MREWLLTIALIGGLGLSHLLLAGQIDPVARANALEAERQQRIMDAIKGGSSEDLSSIDDDVAAKAKREIARVDPGTVEPSQAFGWAKLFHVARAYQGERRLLERYLGTNPRDRFAAQLALLMTCVELKDGRGLAENLAKVGPESDPDKWTLASLLGGTYHYTIRDGIGPKATIDAIDRVAAMIPRAPYASDEARKSCGWARRQLADAKALYLVESGDVATAIALLDEAIRTLDKDVYRVAELNDVKKRYEMIGKAAPPLPANRSHGQYVDLWSLRGKVVVLDFTAHWCHACIASLPSLGKLYRDLHPEGLEIVSVTKFYGHFQAERAKEKDMPEDEEFARMPAWMAKYGVVWPMVYAQASTFKAYGVAGIPQVVMIDRQGKVRTIDLGFSDAKFARFRRDVEAALKGPSPD